MSATTAPSAYPFASIASKNDKNPHSPPSFLQQDPSYHLSSSSKPTSPYILSSTNPTRNKRRTNAKGPLTISPPAPTRRCSSVHTIKVSPATTPKYRAKFHASRPRPSPYTPSSASFSVTPRLSSFAPSYAEAFDVFPPTPRQCSMTPRTPPAFIVIEEFPSPPRSSVGSEIALSLGTFETLPSSFQPQPSPPCSPNPSPIYPSFLSNAQSSFPSSSATRAARIQSGSCTTPTRSPLSATSRNSPYDSKPPRLGSTSPSSAPKKAKEFLGVGGNDVVRTRSARSQSSSPAETQASKAAKERRKKAERSRPLPYAKKLEIDEFFGKEAKPHKSKAGPSSRNDAHRTGSTAERNVGGGGSVEHVGEDGTVWLDVEEEQEWAWLMSEVGRGAQPLPYWPQQFSCHLRSSVTASRNALPSFDEERDPLDASSTDVSSAHLHAHGQLAPATSSADHEEAWAVPPKMISVLDMIDSPLTNTNTVSDTASDAGSDAGASVSSRKEKKRPKPLKLFGSSSSPAASAAATKPRPIHPSRNISSSSHHSTTSLHAAAQGKDEFLSSAFHPSSASLPSPTMSTYTDAGVLDPITPDDDLVGAGRPSISVSRARTRSGGSRKSMGAPDAAVKEKKGGFGAIKGFFKKVGGGDGKH